MCFFCQADNNCFLFVKPNSDLFFHRYIFFKNEEIIALDGSSF